MRSQEQLLFVVVAFLWLLSGLMTLPSTAQAQVSSDTAARVDSSQTSRPVGDSLANKAADSTSGTKPDSGTNAPAQRPPAASPPSPPAIDSAFSAACNPPPPSSPATSILLVTFSPTLTDRERLGIAKAVGGSIVGVAGTGERYMRVSGRSTRSAADSLILYQGVVQVSERPCFAGAPSGR